MTLSDTVAASDARIRMSAVGEERTHLLAPPARDFLLALHDAHAGPLEECLAARRARQAAFDGGERPCFAAATRDIRDGDWQVAPPPADLVDRRVEITGPPERAMVVNALNSGACVYMADFEDALAPTWGAVIEGQQNVHDAIRRRIDFTAPSGKSYRLGDDPATLMVRPRGLHLTEKHCTVDDRAIPAALFDAGLFLYHNARELLGRGSGPYLYLAKLESAAEARLWNDVLEHAERYLELPQGSIRVTVLIETLPAAFEMDEILYALRGRICGLNCGRWDYIFSFIKTFRADPAFVLPDRDQVTMERHFLRSYSRLLIRTCHRRGCHAMGGMAPHIPVRDDPEANEAAMASVRADKQREVQDGHDGTWVAHPGLVPVAKAVFDDAMPEFNQVDRACPEYDVTAEDLLTVPAGRITDAGLRGNVSAAVRYMGAWLAGRGCVPIHGKMEDAATAEIARAQLWQWLHHGPCADADGRAVTSERLRAAIGEELETLRAELDERAYADGCWQTAAGMLDGFATADTLADFLTTSAYERLD